MIAGDETDVYLPQPKVTTDYAFHVALFLQGFDVDKSCYSQFARQLASYGFLVLVPNHKPVGRPFFAPELEQISKILESLIVELQNSHFLNEKLDIQRVALLGHSAGGLTGLQALQNILPVSKNKKDDLLPKLVGGVFYGSQFTGVQMKKKKEMPIALISGNLDGIVSPELTKKTYENLQSIPKAYMTIKGTNHYGITDTAQPPDGPKEEHLPLLEQHISTHKIAHWSAIFLRAYLLNDKVSRKYFSCNDCQLDEVTSLIDSQIEQTASSKENK